MATESDGAKLFSLLRSEATRDFGGPVIPMATESDGAKLFSLWRSEMFIAQKKYKSRSVGAHVSPSTKELIGLTERDALCFGC